MMTGVPVQRIAQAEGARLLEMAPTLRRQIIGQDAAVEKIVKAIQRNRIGLKVNTSGWAFSISSSSTTEYGRRLTFSVSCPPSSYPNAPA